MNLKEGCEVKCKGCTFRETSQKVSLEKKVNWIKHSLHKWADLIEPINSIPEEESWNYREKITLATSFENNVWNVGMSIRKTREFIAINSCPIHTEKIISTIKLLASALSPPEKFPLRFWVQSGRQLCLVLKTKEMPSCDWLSDSIKSDLATIGIDGLWLHLNPSTGKKIFAKKHWELIYGIPYSVDNDGAAYGPTAFQQLIPKLYNDSIQKTLDFFLIERNDLIIDLYCGIGKSIMQWGKYTSSIAGVESSAEAIKYAIINNPQASLYVGMCEQRIPQLNNFVSKYDIVGVQKLLYVNPPRTGLGFPLVNWITNEYKPEKLAYLSCSTGTLNRDLELLMIGGYEVIKIIPYDFFPHTIHVETLALLKKL